jgi:4-hydroxybutyrate dehydrogenase/sulfolactaldehyde 3-reductase
VSTERDANENSPILGFIGLGSMGSKLVANLQLEGKKIMVYDINSEAVQKVIENGLKEVRDGNAKYPIAQGTVKDISTHCETIISILPNDDIVNSVSLELLQHKDKLANTFFKTHISCSTVSPVTSRTLDKEYQSKGKTFIASPVFARPGA